MTENSPASSPDSRLPGTRASRKAVYVTLALALMLGAYSNHFENSFHYDDFSVIENNVYLRSLSNIPQFFRQATTYATNPSSALYRPLAGVSYALDYWWGGGLNVGAFHCTQLACHLLVVLLAGLLARRLLRRCGAETWAAPLALFGAAFFGIHLVQTEILNIITLRSEILSTLGAVGSLYMYECLPQFRRYGAWLLPMIIGAFAKPPALMLAPLLAVYLVLLPPPEADGRPAAMRVRIRHAAAAFAVAAGLYILQDRMGGQYLVYGFVPRGVYLQTQMFAWLHYLRLYALPLGLTVDWNWPPIDRWHDTRVLIGVFFNGLFLAGAVGYARFRPPLGRLFLFGALWFYIALAPASSLIPLSDMAATYRTYFPFIGLTLCVCALAAEALQWAGRTGRARIPGGLALAGGLLLAAHAAGVYQRNRDFRDEKSLWLSVLRLDSENARAWSAVGFIALQERQFGDSRRSFERSLKLRPGQFLPLMHLGSLELMEGRLQQAEAYYLRAMALAPNQVDIYIAYAGLLIRQRRAAESVAVLEKALALAPTHFVVHRLLLGEYRDAGNLDAFCRLGHETRQLLDDPALVRELAASCPIGAGP